MSARVASAPGAAALKRVFWAVLGVTLAFRLWLAWWFPSTGDEAYFVHWGEVPALGYYDHPPLVGWVLAALLELSRAKLVLRLPAVVLPALIAIGSTTSTTATPRAGGTSPWSSPASCSTCRARCSCGGSRAARALQDDQAALAALVHAGAVHDRRVRARRGRARGRGEVPGRVLGAAPRPRRGVRGAAGGDVAVGAQVQLARRGAGSTAPTSSC